MFLSDPREDGTYPRRTSASRPHCSSTPKIHNSPRGSQEVCRYPAHPACTAKVIALRYLGHIQCANALLCSYRKLQVLRKVFSTCLRRLLSMSRCWWISPKDSQVSFSLWGSLEELNQTGGMNQRKIQVLRKGFKLIICTSDLPFTCHEDKLEAFSSKLCYD